MAVGSTGSLPRNLAATLQDIETKRQLALQQKGEVLTVLPHPICQQGALFSRSPRFL